MEPRDYLQELRIKHILTPSKSKCLENIIMRVHDGKVVCVTLKAYDNVSSRTLKKSGLTGKYTIIQNDLPQDSIGIVKFIDKQKVDAKNGEYMLIYSTKDAKVQMFTSS